MINCPVWAALLYGHISNESSLHEFTSPEFSARSNKSSLHEFTSLEFSARSGPLFFVCLSLGVTKKLFVECLKSFGIPSEFRVFDAPLLITNGSVVRLFLRNASTFESIYPHVLSFSLRLSNNVEPKQNTSLDHPLTTFYSTPPNLLSVPPDQHRRRWLTVSLHRGW